MKGHSLCYRFEHREYFLITAIVISLLVRERQKLMACFTVLFVVILTASKVTSRHCSSQQLPSSGDDDFQKVTILQYCLVDNCTIKRMDTGEILDIAYTTYSLIVATPTDGRTSEVIAKQGNELPCLNPDGPFEYRLREVVEIVEFFLTFVVSGYIIAIHLMFKELRNLLGKLLILYSVSVLGMCISYIGILLTPIQSLLNLLAFCYVCTIGLIISSVSIEALATCILSHIATTMRHSYKMRSSMSKETSQRHFKFYAIYTVGITLLDVFLTICFDVATANYKDAILPNGQCVTFEVGTYGTLQITFFVNGIHKLVQLVHLITYIYYTYKLSKDIRDAGISSDQQSYLHKVAIAMGAFIGLAYFLFTLTALFDLATIIIPFTQALFLMQQSAVVAIFLCSKKVRRLHGDCLSKD